MTSLGKKLDDFYRRLGNRGLLLVLFAAALTLNVVFVFRMSVPVLPGEFNTAAWSAYFSGFAEAFERSGDLASSGSPWLTGFLYTPVYYLIDNPVVRYRSMLIMNGVLASLIPLLTFKITAALGLEKAWQRTLCTLVAGISAAVFAHTKFITAAVLCVFLPFLLFYLFIRASNTKNRVVRFFLSLFTAAALGFAPAAEPRLWALVISFILLVFYSRYILRVKTFSFAGFFPAFAGFTVLQIYINERLTGELFAWGAIQGDYIAELYFFAISTRGIGVLGICLCVSAFMRKDSPLKAFAFFALVYNTFMLFTDSASIFLVLFAFCYIFMHGLDFKKTMFSAITLGIIFILYYNAALLAEVSAVFCIIALLFVLVSCAERYKRHMITFCLSLTLLYTGLSDIPNQAESKEALVVSRFIYNSPDAPPTYIINSAGLAPVLRFLNRNTVISTAENYSELPEDCFVITRTDTGELVFSAHGERAEAYALSQEG
ncbi:MAG: hypothetical protein FWE74_01000 [Oscillospiraceae bacterium]|nr:hypothetical protein [Oscillospiraceae bacterium]